MSDWITNLWLSWRQRRWNWRFQLSKAAELNDRELLHYAAGNGNHQLFAKACFAEARRRRLV